MQILEGNKVFEEQYNKLVDDYSKNASKLIVVIVCIGSRQFKFSSVGVSEAIGESPNIKTKKLCKWFLIIYVQKEMEDLITSHWII